MVGNQVSRNIEPTPEFNAEGRALLTQWEQGDLPFRELIQALNQMLKHATRTRHHANEARAQHFLGYVQHYSGNLSTSIMHYEKSRRLFKRIGNLNRVSIIDLNQGENYRMRGEFARARRLYQAAYTGARDHDNHEIMAMAIMNEGLTLLDMGDYDPAREALLEGYHLFDAMPSPHQKIHEILAELHHAMARIDCETGQIPSARQQALETLHHAEISQNAMMHGYALRLMGDIRTQDTTPIHETLPQTSDEFYFAAIHIFQELGADGEAARTIFARAKSMAQRGKKRAAAKLYRDAMTAFTRLDMTYDAARAADAQLKLL
ncbi:MAG: hypothetical protein ACPG7F_14285 [Aggregatilineales bacterium]